MQITPEEKNQGNKKQFFEIISVNISIVANNINEQSKEEVAHQVRSRSDSINNSN